MTPDIDRREQPSRDAGSPTSSRTVRSVSHATALLRLLSRTNAPQSLSRLARTVGLSKPAAYALLSTLATERMVRRDEAGRYAPGWGLYELSVAVTDAELLRRAAREPLHRLALATHGAALVSVVDRDCVLYIDREDDRTRLAMVADIGVRSPLHSTASGKVFLATMSPLHAAGYLRGPLRATTAATITDPHRLVTEIVKTKDHGYSVCWGEQERPLSSVAVPVLRDDGHVCAALAVAVATEDLMRTAPSQRFRRLAEASAAISKRLRALRANHKFINA